MHSPEQALRLSRHRLALALRHRCGACAERVAAAALLRSEPCNHCNQTVAWTEAVDVDHRIEQIASPWRRKRWWIYGLLALAALVTGAVPLVASLLTLAALVAVRYLVLRPTLAWLSPKRRALTKLLLRQALVLVGLTAVVVEEALTLVPLAGWALKVIVLVGAVAGTVLTRQ